MKFIGINRLWYLDSLTSPIDKVADLVALLNATGITEVKNSHNGTFTYTHDDPEVTDYINELTGKVYHRDKTTNGTKTIAFSIGEYDLEAKQALQGGKVNTNKDVWEAGDNDELVYKCVIAQVKTGNFVVFTNASITAKVDTREKGLMLGVSAVAMDNENESVADEYWVGGKTISFNKTTKKWATSQTAA